MADKKRTKEELMADPAFRAKGEKLMRSMIMSIPGIRRNPKFAEKVSKLLDKHSFSSGRSSSSSPSSSSAPKAEITASSVSVRPVAAASSSAKKNTSSAEEAKSNLKGLLGQAKGRLGTKSMMQGLKSGGSVKTSGRKGTRPCKMC